MSFRDENSHLQPIGGHWDYVFFTVRDQLVPRYVGKSALNWLELPNYLEALHTDYFYFGYNPALSPTLQPIGYRVRYHL